MKKLNHLLSRAEFHTLLVTLSLIVFSWPFLIPADLQRPQDLFVHLFLPWLVVIVLLFLVGRSDEPAAQECEEPRSDEAGGPADA
jgi:hypothetical protein